MSGPIVNTEEELLNALKEEQKLEVSNPTPGFLSPKENAPPPPLSTMLLSLQSSPLTAAQDYRISRNFRSAKALLTRNNNRPIPSPSIKSLLADIPPNCLPTPPSSATDEDLDDDFFHEVDAICEIAICEMSTAMKLGIGRITA